MAWRDSHVPLLYQGTSAAEYRAAAALLAARPYVPDPALPLELLRRHYDLTGSVAVLASEFERTLAVEESAGQRLILKLSDRSEAVNSFRFQSAVLGELQNVSDVRLPRVRLTRNGERIFQDGAVCGYLQSRVEGVPLHTIGSTIEVLTAVGEALARLGLALARIEAPAARRPVLWHIGSWPWLTELLPYLPAGPTADDVCSALSDYVANLEPLLGALDWQITHNDPSPFNMLQGDAGIAFIDFGDGGWNPRVQDLVIAASHFVTSPDQPLGGAGPIIAGYHAVRPLTDLEMRLLVGMIRARQTALILINYWRAELFPSNAEYIKKNVKRAEKGLRILSALNDKAGQDAVRDAVASRA